MFHLLVVAFLLAGSTADQDLEAEESAPPIQVYNLDEVHHGHVGDHKKNQEPYNVYLKDLPGHKGQTPVDRIVSDLYNPDYYEPITVLDYRYLKSGGRDYARDAGGQILILPKNVRLNQKKEFANYDELLEFLRLQQIAEIEAQKIELSKLGYAPRLNDYYRRRIEVTGDSRYENRNYYPRQQGYAGVYKRDAEAPLKNPQEAAVKTKE